MRHGSDWTYMRRGCRCPLCEDAHQVALEASRRTRAENQRTAQPKYAPLPLYDDRPWIADAACARADPDEWFPSVGGSTRRAKRICAGCPVQPACLDYALTNHIREGVWGGVSDRDRVKLEKGRAA